MKQNINIIDNCGCPTWTKKLLKTVVLRTNIQVNEIVIWDFTDKRLEMRAEIWDADFEGWVEKRLTLKYYKDRKNPVCMQVSYSFYDNQEVEIRETLPNGRTCCYKSPIYLDQGAYRIFGYWSCPKCVRISD